MTTDTIKQKTAKGLLWGGIASGGQQLLNFAFGVILAHLLGRSDYGMVGTLSVIILISSALQEGGFISALNKRQHATAEDYNSVFWFNVTVSISMYCLLFFCLPPVILYYLHEPKLVPLTRFAFIGFVISSFNIVPRAYLFRELKVKETTIITLTAQIVSGISGVIMALAGMSYWGLASQSIIYAICITIGSYYVTRWKPMWHFNAKPIKEMFGFSSKLIITYISNAINYQFFSVLFSKYYGMKTAGDYSQANKWNTMGYTLVSNMLNQVAQPVFARLSTPEEQLKTLRKLLQITSMFSFAFMFGLALISHEFIVSTMGAKWVISASILTLLSIGGAFIPLQNLFTNLLIARGHSNTYMWGNLSLTAVILITAVSASSWGMMWMLRIFVVINIGWLFVWHYFVRKETGLTVGQLLADILPYLLLSAGLCLGTEWLTEGIGNNWLRMLLKISIVGISYVTVLRLLKISVFMECLQFLRERKKAKR